MFNVTKIPLKFPVDIQISSSLRQFIQLCLEKDESKRIGWDKIFEEEILVKEFDASEKIYEAIQFAEKSKQIYRKIQNRIHSKKMDVEKQIFSRFDKQKQLNKKEFYNLIKQINNQITEEETSYIYDKVDINKNGLISLDEFKVNFVFWDFNDANDYGGRLIYELQEVIKAR